MKPINELTILITGSTDGIGKLAALNLANQNANVIIHGRNEEKVKKVIGEIKRKSSNDKLEGFTADFSSMIQVRKFADELFKKISSLDVLINNAGAGMADPRYSKDGCELRFAVNYLAPFLLTHLLLPLLKKAAPARIVNVSSAGQHSINFDDVMLEKSFEPYKAYSQSKLALIMFTFDMAEKLKNDNITVNCLHPGTYLDTNMVRRANISPWGKPETGADAEAFLAASPSLDNITGKYFNVKTESRADSQAYDIQARKLLREFSLELTDLK